MNELKGMHHVTAITSSAEKNYEFFTYVLGMRAKLKKQSIKMIFKPIICSLPMIKGVQALT